MAKSGPNRSRSSAYASYGLGVSGFGRDYAQALSAARSGVTDSAGSNVVSMGALERVPAHERVRARGS